MTEQPHTSDHDAFVTRRMALTILTLLPATLIKAIQTDVLIPSIVESFLAQTRTAITACWYIFNFNSESMATVEYRLSQLLPTLVTLARRPSIYQKKAANLASQASLLMDLIAYHRFSFRESLLYAQQTCELAQISEDKDLHVYALLLLGGAFDLNNNAAMMLQKHQEAALHLKAISPALQSYVLAELAFAHAQNGQVQEADRRIQQAREFFPETFDTTPSYIASDYGEYQLILFEGLTALALATADSNRETMYSTRARQVLSRIDWLPSTENVPKRSYLEITNQRARAAIGEKNLDLFEVYFTEGITGANGLGSTKRREEVLKNGKAALRVWPHEHRVHTLIDAI